MRKLKRNQYAQIFLIFSPMMYVPIEQKNYSWVSSETFFAQCLEGPIGINTLWDKKSTQTRGSSRKENPVCHDPNSNENLMLLISFLTCKLSEIRLSSCLSCCKDGGCWGWSCLWIVQQHLLCNRHCIACPLTLPWNDSSLSTGTHPLPPQKQKPPDHTAVSTDYIQTSTTSFC